MSGKKISREDLPELALSILRQSPAGYFVAGRDYRMIYANPVLEKQYGKVDGRFCHDYFYSSPNPCTWCCAPEVLEKGKVIRRVQNESDGRTLEIVRLAFEWKGHESCQLGIITDISRRKVAEDARRENELILQAYNSIIAISHSAESPTAMLQQTIDLLSSIGWLQVKSAMAAFLLNDKGTKLLLAAHRDLSPGTVETCREVHLGQCICGRAAESKQTIHVDCIDDLHETTYPGITPHGHFVIPLKARDDLLGVLNLYLEPGRKLNPLQIHFLEGVADIIAAEMRQRKAEKTREQLESQLFQAQKMEAIGRLAGGVAHDFNNILTAITSYSELGMLKLTKDDPSWQMFDEIINSADRAAGLTRHLLAFSRRQIMKPEALYLNEVIEETTKMLTRLIGEDIELVTVLGPDLYKVMVDPGNIEQVLANLAVNSREAMPDGGKLTIMTSNVRLEKSVPTAHYLVPPGDYVCLSVTDTGVGMTSEVLSNIFEPFFTTREQEGGSGLGLSTVFGIVKQSGGYITTRSAPGEGTSFFIYLPPLRQDNTAPDSGTTFAKLPKGDETILLAEDDETVRKITSTVLKDMGYQVLEAVDGEDAVRISRDYHHDIHLLISDMVMPNMNGRQLYETICAERPGIRVLFISGYIEETIKLQKGHDESHLLLTKPFSPSVLLRKVRQLLDPAPD